MGVDLKKIDRIVLIHDYSEVLGGASYLVDLLIGSLVEMGIPVTFFSGDSGENSHVKGVEFIPLGGVPLLQRSVSDAFFNGFWNQASSSKITEWIKINDTKRTIYHLHGWTKTLSVSIFHALRLVSDRVILHAHDYFNACPNGAFYNFKKELDCHLMPRSLKCVSTQCDKNSYAQKIWRLSRDVTRKSLCSISSGGARVLLIHPGQLKKFAISGWPEKSTFVVKNPILPISNKRICAEKNRKIVFIGRISREKGADIAASLALSVGADISFVGAGDQENIVKSINPMANFVGHVDRDGISKILHESRIALMPGRWSEPFGLAAVEAIGSGVPAVVSKNALMANDIEKIDAGISIDIHDFCKSSEVINKLTVDDDLVRNMSLNGFNSYKKLSNDPVNWVVEVVYHYNEVLKYSVN